MNAHDNDMNDPNEQDPIKVWQEFHRDNAHLWTPRRKRLESTATATTSGAFSADGLEAAAKYDECCQRLQCDLVDRLRREGFTLQRLKESLSDSEASVLRLMTTQVSEHIRRTGNIPWERITLGLEDESEDDSEASDEEPEELAVDAMDQSRHPFMFVPTSTLTHDDDPAKGLPWYPRQPKVYKEPAVMHQPATQHRAVPSTLAGPSAARPGEDLPPVPAVVGTASSDARFSAYSLVSDANTRGTSPLPPAAVEDRWDTDKEQFYGGYTGYAD